MQTERLRELIAKWRTGERVGDKYTGLSIYVDRTKIACADELEAALAATPTETQLRAELRVGDEVWLKGKILEIVEPHNRGIGVDVTVGEKNFSFPIWCDASVLAICVPAGQP